MLEHIKGLIDKLFSDTSVEPEDTLAALDELRGHIDMMIEALECDING